MHGVAAWWADRSRDHTIASSWHFWGAMNFYESTSAGHGLTVRNKDEFKGSRGPAVWLLLSGFDDALIAERGLQVVWRGDRSKSLVAVDCSRVSEAAPASGYAPGP
jgi:hypothetical protein